VGDSLIRLVEEFVLIFAPGLLVVDELAVSRIEEAHCKNQARTDLCNSPANNEVRPQLSSDFHLALSSAIGHGFAVGLKECLGALPRHHKKTR
jgi:hypothetical protein